LSRNHIGNPIHKHGDKPNEQYATITNEMVRDGSISPNAFRVLALLLSHNDEYQESAGEIAKRFGWGRNRAITALRKLESARLLVIQHHVTQNGTRAFEKYHVHMSRRFTEAEVQRLSQTVTLMPKQEDGGAEVQTQMVMRDVPVAADCTEDTTTAEARWIVDRAIPSNDPKYRHADALAAAVARHMAEKGTPLEAAFHALTRYRERDDVRGPRLLPLLLDDALAMDPDELPYVARDHNYYEAIGRSHLDPWGAVPPY
jgi:hypothetical protein